LPNNFAAILSQKEPLTKKNKNKYATIASQKIFITMTFMLTKLKNIVLLLLSAFFINPVFALSSGSKCQLAQGITINSTTHKLALCLDNQVVKEFQIALGRGGIGKRKQDDKKTPLGLYDLQMPHASKRFDVFIPINYPTPGQRSKGFTGTDVGIHGPVQKHTWLKWMNRTTTSVDWTFGCIALEKNSEIEYIADWIAKHPNAKVIITR
jgi:murein L,D-transpeptidase YafK